MKHLNSFKKILSVVTVLLMCFILLSLNASSISLETKGSVILTTVDKESETPISGAVFRIYHIATVKAVTEGVLYTYTDNFKDNGMEIGNLSDNYLPVHLSAYAMYKAIPYSEKSTDENGKVIFENLDCGAYLIVPMDIDCEYVSPTPFTVAIPIKNTTHNTWIYHIDATPKIMRGTIAVDKQSGIKVEKKWENTNTPPESITVALVKDGVIEETVELSESNNWFCEWKNLDKHHSWSVIEIDVPKGYRVSYEATQMSVIITNTGEGKPEEPTTKPEETTKPDELIQTGQLNWPVPTFTIAGLLLFSIGWSILKFGKKDEEPV